MNYYELLDIDRGADAVAIKRAYFAAVKTRSPDSDPEGFKAIRMAYETLSDEKKRGEYDAYFLADDGGEIAADMRDGLLAARAMMRENKFKQSMEFLTGLSGENPDSVEAKRLLADSLWRMKKSGLAEKICVELLEKNPRDCDTLVLRGEIAASRGHTTKADEYFTAAVDIDPRRAKSWIAYMRFSSEHYTWRTFDILCRAMEHDPDMFRDDYVLYLSAESPFAALRDFGLYNDAKEREEFLPFLDKFAEFFINDKAPSKNTYERIMRMLPGLVKKAVFAPFVERIMPTLENSRHHEPDDKEGFKRMRISLALNDLRADKRVHDVLVDLTWSFLSGEDEKDEKYRLSMECYIVSHLPELRPAIKALKNDHPEYFKLNQAFYVDALNEKKTEYLEDKYAAIYKKHFKPRLKGYMEGEEDDDFDDEDDGMPFVRESPKIGRNVPCPCGSGKKYKKCCGK